MAGTFPLYTLQGKPRTPQTRRRPVLVTMTSSKDPMLSQCMLEVLGQATWKGLGREWRLLDQGRRLLKPQVFINSSACLEGQNGEFYLRNQHYSTWADSLKTPAETLDSLLSPLRTPSEEGKRPGHTVPTFLRHFLTTTTTESAPEERSESVRHHDIRFGRLQAFPRVQNETCVKPLLPSSYRISAVVATIHEQFKVRLTQKLRVCNIIANIFSAQPCSAFT